MSDSQRIKDLEDRLPTVKVSKFSDSFKSLEVKTLSATGMATTETFKYNFAIANPIHYNQVTDLDTGVVSTTTPIVSVIVRRLRNKVSTVLPSNTHVSVGTFDSDDGYPVTITLPKTDVQKKDRITVEFSAPNAKTVIHLMAILT